MKNAVIAKLTSASGHRISDEDATRLLTELVWTPRWFVDLMRQYPLVGTRFVLDEDSDKKHLEVDLRWLTPAQIIDQASNVYPGIAASREQYVPFGVCLFGSGETYFIRSNDPGRAVYVIPHDAVADADTLATSQVERACPSMEQFLEAAKLK